MSCPPYPRLPLYIWGGGETGGIKRSCAQLNYSLSIALIILYSEEYKSTPHNSFGPLPITCKVSGSFVHLFSRKQPGQELSTQWELRKLEDLLKS